MIALRNSGHIGRVGDWAEMAAEAGFISVHFVNVAGSQLVAPFGGVYRRLSTAPFTVGFPLANADPIILDFATSMVAEGKVMVAANGGAKLPPGALIDQDGHLSTIRACSMGRRRMQRIAVRARGRALFAPWVSIRAPASPHLRIAGGGADAFRLLRTGQAADRQWHVVNLH